MNGFAALVAVCVCVGTAVADAPKPWAANVSDAEQDLALAIYKAGNEEFVQGRYAQALAKYRDAIKHWDHPAIRFNMVVCLINLDQPLEAYDDLELALKFGEGPLGAETYAQGLTYGKLLRGQLAKVEIIAKEPGAEVTLDGKKLFTGPGDVNRLVAPGTHQLVAVKAGFITQTTALVLLPGKATVSEVTLVPLATAARETALVRRWKPWKPWALAGAGAAVALAGVGLELKAAADYSSYDRTFGLDCPIGCGGPGQPAKPPSLSELEHRARIENVTAIPLIAVGAATLAGGLAAVYLNQPRAIGGEKLRVTPAAGPGTASIILDGRF